MKEWEWFKASGMINPSGLINDGLTISSTNASECYNNNQTTWSYNQGDSVSILEAVDWMS